MSKRLIEIDTAVDAASPYVAGTLVQRYTLTYTTSQQSRRQLLASVQQCGADGACLPATQFEWAAKDYNTVGKQFGAVTINNLPFGLDPVAQANNGVLVGEWNGDGRSDIFGWKNVVQSDGLTYTHQFYVCLASGSGASAGFTCGAAPLLTAPNDSSFQTAPYDIRLADLNGDGRVDLAWKTNNTNWQVCTSNGDPNACAVASGAWTTATPNGPLLQGDFDGDGRLDVITYLGNNQFQTCFARDSGFKCTTQDLTIPDSTCPVGTPNCEDFSGTAVQYDVLIADVDGDGRADLIRRRNGDDDTNNQWKGCFARFAPTSSSQAPSGGFVCHQQFVHGPQYKTNNNVLYDFNGDGIADMANYASASQTQVCLSTGDGAFEFTDVNVHWDPPSQSWLDSGGAPVDFYSAPRCRLWTGTGSTGVDKVVFGDFNGDGRTDAMSYVGGTTKNVCVSTGSNFACSTWPGPNLGGSNPDLNQKAVFGDFDGDGRTDILSIGPANTAGTPVTATLGLAMGATPTTARAGDVVSKITTGLGATTSIAYAPLTDSGVYTRGSGANPSQRKVDIQSPMYVVRSSDASTRYSGGEPAARIPYSITFTKACAGEPGWTRYVRLRQAPLARWHGCGGRNRVLPRSEWHSQSGQLADRQTSEHDAQMQRQLPQVTWRTSLDASTFANAAAAGSTLVFGANLALVSRTSATWAVRGSTTCGGACAPLPPIKEAGLVQSVQQTWELNGSSTPLPLPTITTSTPLSSLDTFGNQTSTVVSTSDGYSKTTTSVFANATAEWLVGKLQQATVSSSSPDGATGQRLSSFAYQDIGGASCAGAASGQLCIETIQPDEPTAASNQCIALSRCGGLQRPRCTNTTRTATGRSPRSRLKDSDGTALADRATTTTFSDNGRFPTTIVNGLSQSETRSYDHRFGVATAVTGPNGMTTTTLLDGLGRAYGQRAFNASGVKIGETFSPVEATGLQAGEKYRTRTLASGGSESITFFDELQRVVRVQGRSVANGTYAQASNT